MSINKALPLITERYEGVKVFSLWIIGVTVLLISIVIWQFLLRFDQNQASKLLQLRADFVKNELVARFGNRGIILQGMERRWEINKGISKEVWDSDAALYYNHYKGLKAAIITDSSFALRWIFPPESLPGYEPLSFRDQSDKVVDFAQVSIRGEVSVLPLVNLNNGTKGVVMSIPLYSNNNFDGLMLAVFDVSEVFDYILGNIAPGYGISIFINEKLVYTRQEYSTAYHKEWARTASFDLYQVSWKVVIWPGFERFSEVNTVLPAWVLVFGILSSISLVIILYLSQLTKIRAKKIDNTNRELVYEIVERRLAEDKIKLSQDRLNAILNDANAFVCIVSREGGIISLSRYAFSLLGIPLEQTVLGKTVKDVFAPETAAWFYHIISIVVEKGDSVNEQKELSFMGKRIVLRAVFFPLAYEKGYVYAVCCLGIHE